MPVIKCGSCGYVSNYEESGNCSQCTGFIIVPEPEKAAVARKSVGLVIVMLLVFAGGVFGVVRYVSTQKENARLEAEKKRLENFDYVTFNADADSVSKAVSGLPPKFNSPPPSFETLKQTIGEYVDQKRETKKIESPPSADDNGSNDPAAVPTEQVTVFSLKSIEPLEYDYVKGENGKLVCFVSYRAVIRKIDRQPQLIESATNNEPFAESTVKETARYDLENGFWIIKQAGLSEADRKLEINNVRLEAKNMETR